MTTECCHDTRRPRRPLVCADVSGWCEDHLDGWTETMLRPALCFHGLWFTDLGEGRWLWDQPHCG